VAESTEDPDLAPFVGEAHLGPAFLVAARGAAPWLGYLTPMEREEAARSGLPLLSPEELDVLRLGRERPEPDAFLAAVVERGLALGAVAPGRLALAGHAPAGTLHAACRRLEAQGWSFAAGNELLRRLRKTKTAAEVAAVRAAAAGTAAALRRVAALLDAAGADTGGDLWLGAERLRGARLRAEIALALAAAGLAQPEGAIVAAGAPAAVPHSRGDAERPLRAGEALVVDLFPRGRLFADCTRTFCVGDAPAPLAAARQAVEAALAAARRAARAGARGWELQEETCRRLAAAGHPTPVSHPGTTVGYVHGLGHGVGYELHEYPSFRREAGEEGILAPGDVFTLEPGLYDPPAGWGVRLEDLVFLGEDGPEVLTPLPYELDPRAWTVAAS
jgi:Xaa-Pro aminopeptidase